MHNIFFIFVPHNQSNVKPEETIDFHIRWAWHSIARMYNIEASKLGSTMSVGHTLLSIDMENGTPSTKLGPKMGMEARSLTRILKSMEDKGLIYREQDKKDKRMVRVFLTQFGKEKREVSRDIVIKFNLAIQEKLGSSKLNQFFVSIKKINDFLDNRITTSTTKNKSSNE